MIYFLTSSLAIPGTNTLNPENDLKLNLDKHLDNKILNGLFIASTPDNADKCDKYGLYAKVCLEEAGYDFKTYVILDRRNQNQTKELVKQADLIILAGGHVPTQNQFFSDIQLREHIKDYQGVVIGISAGSMNAADIVYAHPEKEGEAISKDYQKFLKGLALTDKMIIPHYNEIKDYSLDGLKIFEEIAFLDSMNKKFYVLIDGSYIYGHDGIENLYGEAYLIENGKMKQICSKSQQI